MDAYVWVQMFCAVQGWQYHPGNKNRLSITEAAMIADEMYFEYVIRKGTNRWDGWQQDKSEHRSSTASSACTAPTKQTEPTSD